MKVILLTIFSLILFLGTAYGANEPIPQIIGRFIDNVLFFIVGILAIYMSYQEKFRGDKKRNKFLFIIGIVVFSCGLLTVVLKQLPE